MRKRRILTRAKRNGDALGETAYFRMAKMELKDAISRNKKLELRDELNNNPLGLGLVIKTLGTTCPLPELDYQTINNIINTFLPDQEQRADEA